MENFAPCLPPLPQTGSAGGTVLLVLLVFGALVLAVMAFKAKSRKAITTLGLLVVMGGIAATLNLAPIRAFADASPSGCGSTAPSGRSASSSGQSIQPGPSVDPTQPATSPTAQSIIDQAGTSDPTQASSSVPTSTETSAPTPTRTSGSSEPPWTDPSHNKIVHGSVMINGTVFRPMSPPGFYPSLPQSASDFLGVADHTDPNGNWNLPSYITGNNLPLDNAVITFYSPGPDGAFGTADDLEVLKSRTGADGIYITNRLAPGTYRVGIQLPSDPDLTATWTWEDGACEAGFEGNNTNLPTEDQGTVLTSPRYVEATVTEETPSAIVNFTATNNFTMYGRCAGPK